MSQRGEISPLACCPTCLPWKKERSTSPHMVGSISHQGAQTLHLRSPGWSHPCRIPAIPDDVIADARSRVGKLEATKTTHREVTNSSSPCWKSGLKAPSSSSKERRSVFEEVVKVQAVLREGEAKVLTEEEFSAARGGKHACLQHCNWNQRVQREKLHSPQIFAHELAELRVCVAELQRERDLYGRPSIGCRSDVALSTNNRFNPLGAGGS